MHQEKKNGEGQKTKFYHETLMMKAWDIVIMCPSNYLIRLLIKNKIIEELVNAFFFRPTSRLVGIGKGRNWRQNIHLKITKKVVNLVNRSEFSRSQRLKHREMAAEVKWLENELGINQ